MSVAISILAGVLILFILVLIAMLIRYSKNTGDLINKISDDYPTVMDTVDEVKEDLPLYKDTVGKVTGAVDDICTQGLNLNITKGSLFTHTYDLLGGAWKPTIEVPNKDTVVNIPVNCGKKNI